MVKILSAACVLLAAGGANAYSTPSRSTLRSMGTKSVVAPSESRRVKSSMKMEGKCYKKCSFSSILSSSEKAALLEYWFVQI